MDKNIKNIFVERFHKAVDNYLSDVKYTGKSVSTVGNYKRRLKYFEDFWAQGCPQGPPVRADVRAWRDFMLDKGTSAKTVRQYLIELGAFFNFCVDEGIYEENPINSKLYPSVRAENQRPYEHILESTDIAKLFANEPQGIRYWPRNYAIITLLLDGKIRNGELLDLRLSDIDFDYGEVVIRRGKGGKYRVVSLHDISLTAILLYLHSGIRPSGLTPDDFLFGTTSAHALGTNDRKCDWHKGSSVWLSELVERHVAKITGKSGFRTHSLRHNGTMLELNNGTSLERLQSELGHSSVTTTEIYAGKLGSKRHQENFKVAISAREYWAEQNKEMLRRKKVMMG